MKNLLFASVATVCLANAAYAADLPVYEAPVAAVVAPYDWSGFYLGLQGGYAWGSADTDVRTGGVLFSSIDPDGDGFVGGAHAGYLYQFDSFVIGAEADIEYSGIDGSDRNATIFGDGEINWMASLRLRAGYAWDRVLLYATGGLAYADVDGGGGPIASPRQGYSDDAWGWTLGAGADYAFTDNWSARLEYRYTAFDDVGSGLAPLYPGFNASTDIDLHAVRVGVSYHF